MSAISKILMPTDEEDAQINAGILSDTDSFALNEQELATLQPAMKILPEVVTAYQRGDFTQTQQKKISLRLSAEVIEYFKKSGSDWQSSINEVLKAYIAQH